MGMSNYNSLMLFGGNASHQRAAPDENIQSKAESLEETTRRRFKGPKRSGHFSIQAFVDSSAGVTSATGLTVWYSNLPNPPLDADTGWEQDTTIGTVIALTSTGDAFINVGNVCAEWIMVKADVTAGTAGIRVFARSEGTDF